MTGARRESPGGNDGRGSLQECGEGLTWGHIFSSQMSDFTNPLQTSAPAFKRIEKKKRVEEEEEEEEEVDDSLGWVQFT